MSTVGLFGRLFTEVGSSSSDFLIKTKGKVKIQWGNKFIDLIKDGKIAVDGFLFHTSKNKESISGSDGFYITDDGGVYIKFGNEIINIFGEVGSTYVSFISEQETSSELKLTALKNIGLVFNTFAEALNAGLQDGIVYIADEGKLYTIKNLLLQELQFDFPNPYPKKFVILIGLGDACSLLIDGYYDEDRSCIVIGKENAGLYLYSTDSLGVVLSKVGLLILEVGDGNQILILNDSITIKPTLICDSLQSKGATSSDGYRLYMSLGESTLEIDNLILRKGIAPQSLTHEELLEKINEEELSVNNYYIINDFQNEWELTTPDDIIDEGDDINVRPLLVLALSSTQLNPRAIMISNPSWEILYDALYNDPVRTKSSEGEQEIPAKGRIILLKDEFNNQCNYDFKHLRFLTASGWVYTFGGTIDSSLDGTAHNNDITVQNYNILSEIALVRVGAKVSFLGEVYNNTIRSLSSDLITSDPFINNTGIGLTNCTIQGSLSNTYFHGLFAGETFSSITNPELGRIDKFTDVYLNESEVRIMCIPDLIIPGIIVMFNGGRDIPAGWAICDGTNGTPNLIGSFIKASNVAGEVGGGPEYKLKESDLPVHNHNISTTPSTTGKKLLAANTLQFGVYDKGGSENYALYSGKNSENENGYELIDNLGLANRLDMTVTTDTYTLTAIKIEPTYYSLIFIMKL